MIRAPIGDKSATFINGITDSDEPRYINMKNGLTYEALKFPEYVSCSDTFKTPHTHQEPILRAFNCSACLLDCSVLFESPADPLYEQAGS